MAKLDLFQQFYNLKKDILKYSLMDQLKTKTIIMKPKNKTLSMIKHLHYKPNVELFFTTSALIFTSLETN